MGLWEPPWGGDRAGRTRLLYVTSLPGRSACTPVPTALYVSLGLGFPANLNYPVPLGSNRLPVLPPAPVTTWPLWGIDWRVG